MDPVSIFGELKRRKVYTVRGRTRIMGSLLVEATSTSVSEEFVPVAAVRRAHCADLAAGSELVVLVFEYDVERGERGAGHCVNRNFVDW